MSWYLAWSQQAVSASSGAQESRPLKSNLIKQFTMSLPNWLVWGYGDHGTHQPPSSNCSSSGASGTGDASYHPGHWGFLPEGLWSMQCCSLPPWLPFLLPGLNSVYVFCTVRPCGKEPSSVHKACTMMLICILLYRPFLPSLVQHGRRRALWSPHSGCTLTGHSHVWIKFLLEAITYLHSHHSMHW